MNLIDELTESLRVYATTLGHGDIKEGIRIALRTLQQQRARDHMPTNQVKMFLKDFYMTGPLKHRTCSALDLYNRYCEWRALSGRVVLPRNTFYKLIPVTNMAIVKKSSGNRQYVYGLYPLYDNEVIVEPKPIDDLTDAQKEALDIEDHFDSAAEDDEWSLD